MKIKSHSLICVLLISMGCPPSTTEDAGAVEPTPTPDAGTEDICVVLSEEPISSATLGCADDYAALASVPIVTSLPGSQSLKVIVDRADDDAVYFLNTQSYPLHWEYADEHLSGNGLPIVGDISAFNTTEYFSPQRRFLLGAITYFEELNVYAYEIAPYDTADLEMIERSMTLLSENAFFGSDLQFHPTSQAIEDRVAVGIEGFEVITTDEIFDGIDYQPLNLAEAYGKLRFVAADDFDDTYLNFRDIVVLESVPNDISVVTGIITGAFQTPLSHINVLSQNRGTPNMGLRGAMTNAELLALDGKWVRLDVNAFDYEIEEVSVEDADTWWEANRPPAVQVPSLDLLTTGLQDLKNLLQEDIALGQAIKDKIPAFGGKASNYAALENVDGIEVPTAFGIPVSYYWQHMEDNGLHDQLNVILADTRFHEDAEYRDDQLNDFRDAIKDAPMDPTLAAELELKLETDYPETRMRFRSSTNAEDLDGFTGAGLYTSKSGELGDPDDTVFDAIKKVWASVWFFRAFEERSFRGIDHRQVGMAVLVHRSFPDEDANGVALTANPFDSSGLEPGFYINVQEGEASVVKPEPGVTTDQFIYQFDFPGQPRIFYAHSSLVPSGENVLTVEETYLLGQALKAIHVHYFPAYGQSNASGWYAMDVEFKFDTPPGGESTLFVKQARPHPGRGN